MPFYKATTLQKTSIYGSLPPFQEGETYTHPTPPILCKEGFHYTKDPLDTLIYYIYPFLLWEVEPLGEVDIGENKLATNKILFKRLLGEEETKLLLTGTYRRYYSNGQLELEINYKEGKLEGTYRSYYYNGKLKEEINWKEGKIVV